MPICFGYSPTYFGAITHVLYKQKAPGLILSILQEGADRCWESGPLASTRIHHFTTLNFQFKRSWVAYSVNELSWRCSVLGQCMSYIHKHFTECKILWSFFWPSADLSSQTNISARRTFLSIVYFLPILCFPDCGCANSINNILEKKQLCSHILNALILFGILC